MSDPNCSFCGKDKHQVFLIVAATRGSDVAICDECIDLSTIVCAQRREARRQQLQLDQIRRLGT